MILQSKYLQSMNLMNTNYPLVSIAIPTYNRAENYLKQSLSSAINQTYSNVEIIVSDNCSIDNTEAVVKGFNDPRIKYFKQEVNIGSVNNSNFCLQQAQGDYFLQLQDDDIIDHDFIDTCMIVANCATDLGIIQSGTRIIDDDGKVLAEYPNRAQGASIEDYFRGWFACETSWYLCSTLFNTKGLKEIGGFKSKHNLFDDAAAMIQLAAKYGRVGIENAKASFRVHAGEETFSANIRNWCEDSLYVLNIICDLVDDQQKNIIRKEGSRFLSDINYGFADKIKSPIKRVKAQIEVFVCFNYKHLPPPLRKIIYNNSFYFLLKFIKKKMSTFMATG